MPVNVPCPAAAEQRVASAEKPACTGDDGYSFGFAGGEPVLVEVLQVWVEPGCSEGYRRYRNGVATAANDARAIPLS